MKSVLLVAAASFATILASPAPASAQAFAGTPQFMNRPSAPGFFPGRQSFRDGLPTFCDGDHHRGRRHGGFGQCAFFGGPWGYYDPDINRSWDSDSYNDWWHDRPDRAFPRWVRHNQNCSPDRMWWSGSGWHC
ncbi:MAG TPA: hypothetical protein VFM42_09000 [Sphingomicrobium sp.]|nr:hypothetical protein [Sphingomicrobium sp.]